MAYRFRANSQDGTSRCFNHTSCHILDPLLFLAVCLGKTLGFVPCLHDKYVSFAEMVPVSGVCDWNSVHGAPLDLAWVVGDEDTSQSDPGCSVIEN